MGKFEFKNNVIELDIAGHLFRVSGTPEYAEKITRQGDAMVRKAGELKESADTQEAMEELNTLLKESLDCMLGEGAEKTIFSERPFQTYDALDVLTYIVTEINAFHEKRQAELSMPEPNRAQRRAAEGSSLKDSAPIVSDSLAELLKNNPVIAEALLKSVK